MVVAVPLWFPVEAELGYTIHLISLDFKPTELVMFGRSHSLAPRMGSCHWQT
jgi:hypothetical protein